MTRCGLRVRGPPRTVPRSPALGSGPRPGRAAALLWRTPSFWLRFFKNLGRICTLPSSPPSWILLLPGGYSPPCEEVDPPTPSARARRARSANIALAPSSVPNLSCGMTTSLRMPSAGARRRGWRVGGGLCATGCRRCSGHPSICPSTCPPCASPLVAVTGPAGHRPYELIQPPARFLPASEIAVASGVAQ